jgi:inner membrane protease subunit 2
LVPFHDLNKHFSATGLLTFMASLWARIQASSRTPFTRQFGTYLLGLATWVPVMVWFNTNVAEITLINGPSMYPFLNSHYNESTRRDLVLNWKLYAQESLARGMIVTFR